MKRILNFGAPAPIDVEILGYDLDQAAAYAKQVRGQAARPARRATGKPLLTDVQISREENYPELDVVVDREKAGVLGLSEQQIAQTRARRAWSATRSSRPFRSPIRRPATSTTSTCGSTTRTARNVSDLSNIFLRDPERVMVCRSTTVARVERGSGPVQITRKYLQRIIDVTANVAPGKDLGAASDGGAARARRRCRRPRASRVRLGGQTMAQKQAFAGPRASRRSWRSRSSTWCSRRSSSRCSTRWSSCSACRSASPACSSMLLATEDDAQREQLHGHHHDGRHRRLERRAARRLRQRAPRDAGRRSIEATDPGGDARGCGPILMTTIATIVGPHADGARHRRGQRDEPAARARGHRRAHGVDVLHAVPGAVALHRARPLRARARPTKATTRPSPPEGSRPQVFGPAAIELRGRGIKFPERAPMGGIPPDVAWKTRRRREMSTIFASGYRVIFASGSFLVHRCRAPRFPRQPAKSGAFMRSKTKWISSCAAVAALALSSAPAAAQPSLALDRFDPGARGRPHVRRSSRRSSAGHLTPHVMLLADYAHNPLVLRSRARTTTVGAVVVEPALLPPQRVARAVEPAQRQRRRARRAAPDGRRAPAAAALTLHVAGQGPVRRSARSGSRLRLFGEYDDAFQLAVGGYVWVPTGARQGLVRERRHGARPARGHRRRRAAIASSGRSPSAPRSAARSDFANVAQGTMLAGGAGLGVLLGDNRHFQIGPEVTVSSRSSRRSTKRTHRTPRSCSTRATA